MNLLQRLARLESKAARTAVAAHGHTCGPIILIDVGQECPPIPSCQQCERERNPLHRVPQYGESRNPGRTIGFRVRVAIGARSISVCP
jgi:hypothetical protein